MKVLIACEESGRVRDAFLALGHDAMSCDLLPTATPGPHHQGDVRDILGDGWDLMVAHPECTYLCRAGQRWLHAPPDERPDKLKGLPRYHSMWEAVQFFRLLQAAPIERIAIENPQPNSEVVPFIGAPDQYVQPWQYGHGETKRTGLWLKNLPPLVSTDVLPEVGPHGPWCGGCDEVTREVGLDTDAPEWCPRCHGEDWRANNVHTMPPGPLRKLLRSRTYPGIAAAMAAQWGGLQVGQVAA